MKWVCFALSLVGISMFAWSAVSFFKPPEKAGFKYNLLALNSIVCYALVGYVNFYWTLGTWQYLLLCVCYCFCIFFFLWAANEIRNQNFSLIFGEPSSYTLVTTGPYKISRNPFYTAYIVFFVATAVLHQSMLLTVLSSTLTAMYVLAIMREEAELENSAFREKYLEYKGATGRFFTLL